MTRLLALLLVLVVNEAAAQAVLRGKVTAPDSTIIIGARVQVTDSAGTSTYSAVTDTAGIFRIRLAHPMRPGLFFVRAEFIGLETLERVPVRIENREEVTIKLMMDIAAIPLEPLRVSARGRYYRGPLDDFLDRAARVKRFGGGFIVDYEELQKRKHMNPVFLIAEYVPSLRNCTPSIWLDGMTVAMDELRTIKLDALEGIEIYRTATMVPVQYQGRSPCGAVLLWTALDDHGKGSPITWRRVIMTATLLTLGILLLR